MADTVKNPESEDEAALMCLLGSQWLEINAPHRLRQTYKDEHTRTAKNAIEKCIGVLKQSHSAISELRDNLSDFGLRLKLGDACWPKEAMRKGHSAMMEIEKLLNEDCPKCGGSGFSGYGMGYGDVCPECGGQKRNG